VQNNSTTAIKGGRTLILPPFCYDFIFFALRFIAFRRRVVAQWKAEVNGKKFLLRIIIVIDINATIFVLFR